MIKTIEICDYCHKKNAIPEKADTNLKSISLELDGDLIETGQLCEVCYNKAKNLILETAEKSKFFEKSGLY